MIASIDNWEGVEKVLADREDEGAFREAVAAMRWLVVRLKADQQLRMLVPGVSHASFVFRVDAGASIWVSSIDDHVYEVSLVVGRDLETVRSTTASENSVIETVRKYVGKKAGNDQGTAEGSDARSRIRAMAMIDDWTDVEGELAARESTGGLRQAIIAMTRLAKMLRDDARFHDLQPSVSLGSLVFRRHARRSVWVAWDDVDKYKVSLVGAGLDFLETSAVKEDGVLDVLLQYLEKAPLD